MSELPLKTFDFNSEKGKEVFRLLRDASNSKLIEDLLNRVEKDLITHPVSGNEIFIPFVRAYYDIIKEAEARKEFIIYTLEDDFMIFASRFGAKISIIAEDDQLTQAVKAIMKFISNEMDK